MLPIVALGLVAVFFVLLRLGILEELPQRLGRALQRRPLRRIGKDTEEERRLEVFKDFFDGDSKPEE
ncbi:MAG TPA: hypothetical protein VIH26_05830 [Anaerolineales bacterium]